MIKAPFLKRAVPILPWIGVPVLVYAGILLAAVPGGRWALVLALGISTLLLYCSSALPAWMRGPVGLAAILLLFGFTLSQLWSTGASTPTVIGGLLPWSDASGYFGDATRLINGQSFSVFSGRRPLFPALLATLLALTNQNLQATLAILTALTAGACYLLFREIEHTHGREAGTVVFLLVFFFYRRFIGQTMTENLGLALGLVSLALLWRGAGQKQQKLVLSGLFMLTVALNARAGAFFILPALILWGGWAFRKGRGFSIQFLGLATGLAVIAFGMNALVDRYLTVPGAAPFSNFSYTLYGLLSGGKGWTWVLTEHPELTRLPNPQQSQRIYQMAIALLRAHPFGLVQGSFKAWSDFLSLDYSGAYGYLSITSSNHLINQGIRLCLYLLTGLGLFQAVRRHSDPYPSLLLAAIFGIWLSIPFVPPVDADEMRAYAATLPFWFLPPALGIALLCSGLRGISFLRGGWAKLPLAFRGGTSPLSPKASLSVGGALIGLTILGGLGVKTFSRPALLQPPTCEAGSVALNVRLTQGTWITLMRDDSLEESRMPLIRLTDFRKGLAGLGYPDLVSVLSTLEAPTSIANVVDLQNGTAGFVLLPGRLDELPNRTILHTCGDWLNLQQKYFLAVKSYTPFPAGK